MGRWDDYRYFQAIKRAGSLKAAAGLLRTDQATVGRRLYALEREIGAKLFEKRSNGFFLTAAGERISASIDRVEAEFDGVQRHVAGEDARLEGVIRIAAPGTVANAFLIPRLRAFTDRHPGISLEFATGPEVVNLAKREADLAIRLVRPDRKNLSVRKIGEMALGFYARPDLWGKHPAPRSATEVARFPFVGLSDVATSDAEAKLLSVFRTPLRLAIRTHAWASVAAGVGGGVGFGVLPDFLAAQYPEVRRLSFLPESRSPVWVVTHPDLRANARVRAFVDEIAKLF